MENNINTAELTADAKLIQFKILLEYFVYHLEYSQDPVYARDKYAEFIAKELDGNGEIQKRFGFGSHHPDGALQACINKWAHFGDDMVCINVDPRSKPSYATGWYLNWLNAGGANIKTRWLNNHIEKLYLSICIVKTKYPQDVAYTLDELGLFDDQAPNEAIKDFFEAFVQLKGKFYEMWAEWEASQGSNNNETKSSSEPDDGDQMADELLELVTNNKNVILTGAPGTGKTYLAKQLARNLVGPKSSDAEYYKAHVKFVQFHPSYDYTDFVEGLRPIDKDGQLGFERKDGIFKKLCHAALAAPNETFVLIIDEINRGQVSKIFGELFFALDPDYRGPEGLVETQYQNMVPDNDDFKEGFYVPENVYIIGTMNDIDHSLEPLDFAFRRRFAWYEILAEKRFEMLSETKPFSTAPKFVQKVEPYFTRLNDMIKSDQGFGTAYQVGPAYFLKLKNFIPGITALNDATPDQVEDCMNELWEIHLKPLLQECLKVNSDTNLTLEDLENAFLNTKSNEDINQSGEQGGDAQG